MTTLDFETTSFICYSQYRVIFADTNRDPNAVGTAVFGYIAHRFLQHSKESCAHHFRNLLQVAHIGQCRTDSMLSRKLSTEAANPMLQSECQLGMMLIV